MLPSKEDHVFISYSRKDSEIVQRIIKFLGSQGIKVWIDKQGLQPGEASWIKELEFAIENASAVVVVLSPDAKESPWVGNEKTYARAIGKRIFTVLARGDEKSAIPIDLITIQWIDIRMEERNGLISLQTAIEHHLEKVEADRKKAREDAAIPVSIKAARASQKIKLKIGNNAIFEDQGFLLSPPLARAAYSDRMAWILATMAKLSYIAFDENEQETARLKHNLESGGFKLVQKFHKEGTCAYLAKSDAYAVLAFRGAESASLNDVLAESQGNRQSTGSGKVHFGYNNAYASLANLMEEGLARVSELPLYVTGHSSGGALATIATQQLESALGDRIAACYTFGSPRVGNADFERLIKSAVYRVVNASDVVTLLPFLSMGYIHIGDVRYLGPNGELYKTIPSIRRLSIMMGLIFRLGAPLIRDHAIDEYIRKLEKIAIERNRDVIVGG